MKDYSEMSDNEINQCMTAVVDGCENWCLSDDENCFYDCGIDGNQFYEVKIKDYCNNPSDAWPIIVENKIGITFVNGEWRASSVAAGYHEFSNINALRAVCCCFLLMNNVDISA